MCENDLKCKRLHEKILYISHCPRTRIKTSNVSLYAQRNEIKLTINRNVKNIEIMKKLSLLFLTVMLGMGAFAQTTYYWRAEATNGNWNDANNWWTNTTALPNGGEILSFGNDNQLTMTNDLSVNNRHQIIFTSYATKSRTITGTTENTFNNYNNNSSKKPKIENNSSANQTIGFPLKWGNSTMELKPVSGDLTINSIINNNGKWTDVVSGNGKTLSIASMFGTGGLSIISNQTTVKITGTSTYSGKTYVNFGTLELQADLSSEEIIVANGAKLIINGNDVDVQKLTINSGGTVEVLPGKSLTVNGVLTNNGILTLKSDANGTATIKTLGTVTNGGTTNYNVEQYLSSGRQWWYLSSPVSAATSNVFAPAVSTNKIGTYVEDYLNDNNALTNAPYYTDPYNAGSSTALSVGKGYVVKLSSQDGGTYTFTGGSLNNGDIRITPTRTGTSNAKRGFNLIGNPYPSYIDWDLLYDPASATNMRNAIWFRTWNGTAMDFHTYSDGEGVPDEASAKIAPMQGFWVKVHADGSNGSLTFKNAHRSHKAESGYNPLKVKTADDRQRVRLVLSDGTNSDETLIVGKSYASDSQDAYDIEKMSNESADISEIYSMIGTETMVINSVAPITAGKTVALGIRSTSEKAYSITASQLQNIPTDVRVILVDAEAETETELSEGVSYNFVASAGALNNRFSIQFRSPGATTQVVNDSKNQILVYSNSQQQIEIISTESLPAGTQIRVFNAAGQTIAQMQAAGNRISIPASISKGVYFCHIENTNQNLQYKVIVR